MCIVFQDAHAHALQWSTIISKHMFSNCLYESNKFNFLLEQLSLARKRDEYWAGLEPAPLTVQESALTFRPPADHNGS